MHRKAHQFSGVLVAATPAAVNLYPRTAFSMISVAESAAFFSFGTNDLTQTTYGLSRDDAASFIGAYQRLGIFEHDPFVSIDTKGVGELIRIALSRVEPLGSKTGWRAAMPVTQWIWVKP